MVLHEQALLCVCVTFSNDFSFFCFFFDKKRERGCSFKHVKRNVVNEKRNNKRDWLDNDEF